VAHSFSSGLKSTEAVVTTKAPLSYFSFVATLNGVVPDDYTNAAKMRAAFRGATSN